MQMRSKNYVVNKFGSYSGLLYKSQVRITSESYVKLTLRSYIIKPSKWNHKVTFRRYITIMLKNHIRIKSGSNAGFTSGNFVIKSCKQEQKIGNHYVIAYAIITSYVIIMQFY